MKIESQAAAKRQKRSPAKKKQAGKEKEKEKQRQPGDEVEMEDAEPAQQARPASLNPKRLAVFQKALTGYFTAKRKE